jgi:folate-dependent phosphoribosylglycinamide formyltransferase PurN
MAQVVLLTSAGPSGCIVASKLAKAFPDLTVIVEQPVSRAKLLRRRLRRLGAVRVAGQVLFMLFQKFQHRAMHNRIEELVSVHQLEDTWPPHVNLVRVSSVNEPDCISQLKACEPRVVLVAGTRLIERAVLDAISAPFINYHAGITPKYRGVHGGYWAKVEDDLGNFGVTVHLIDEGIDTGAVLYQARATPAKDDNFSTFPYLQIAAALPLMEQAARDAIAGALKPRQVDLPSRLWSHPTIWFYLMGGLRRGVW